MLVCYYNESFEKKQDAIEKMWKFLCSKSVIKQEPPEYRRLLQVKGLFEIWLAAVV